MLHYTDNDLDKILNLVTMFSFTEPTCVTP